MGWKGHYPWGNINPVVMLLLFIVVVLVVPAGIALRARPLGHMPYRWATFLGVSSALSSPFMLVPAFLAFAAGHVLGGLLFAVEAALSIWSCFGLLQRKRIGALVFAALWAAEILSGPFVERRDPHPYMQTIKSNPPSLSELVAGARSFSNYRFVFMYAIINTVLTYIYFKKRWPLMAGQAP
jgi:hypothetical protein